MMRRDRLMGCERSSSCR